METAEPSDADLLTRRRRDESERVALRKLIAGVVVVTVAL